MNSLRCENKMLMGQKHLKKEENVTKKIDNDVPLLKPANYFSTSRFGGDLSRIKEIMQMNKKLIISMNTCYRTTRSPDESEIIAAKMEKAQALKAQEREGYLKTIMKENQQIKRRISEATSSYKQEVPKVKRKVHGKNSSMDSINRKNINCTIKKWSILPAGEISNPKKRKTCFFDIKIDGIKRGRLLFDIYCDIVPKTAKNFISLCKEGSLTTYKRTTLHQVFSGSFCLGGEVSNFSGNVGDYNDREFFPDENYILEHAGPGVISMFNSEPNHNDTHFLITFKKLSTLNGRFVVFGRLKTAKSLEVLEMIEEFGTKSGNPIKQIVISGCGVL